jgi:hypothetical protein
MNGVDGKQVDFEQSSRTEQLKNQTKKLHPECSYKTDKT